MATAPYVINPDDPTQPTENLTMGAAAAELRGLKQRVLLAREETADLETRALTHEGANPYELDAQLNANGNKITELPTATGASDATPLSQVLALMQERLGFLSQITWAPGLAIEATPTRQWTVVAGQAYVATSNHVAGATFAADLAAGFWLAVDAMQVLADLASTASGKGAEMVAFKPVGAGAVDRTVSDKLREFVSVKDFGAIGDGVTGESAAIQSAINSGHGDVYIPNGEYLIDADIIVPNNVCIRFSKKAVFKASANGRTFFKSTFSAYFSQIHGAQLDGNGFSGVTGFDMTNFRLNAGVFNPNMQRMEYGFVGRSGCFGTPIDNPTAYGVKYPLVFVENNSGTVVKNPNFDNSVVAGGDGAGVGVTVQYGAGSNLGSVVIGGYIQGFAKGVQDEAIGTVIDSIYFEACTSADVDGVAARVSRYVNLSHWGGIGAVAYKLRNCDAIQIESPVMGSGARAAMFDVDGTNTNCIGVMTGSNASYNTPKGDVSGILLSGHSSHITVTDASGASLSLTQNTQAAMTISGKVVTISADITYPTTSDMSLARIALPYEGAAGVQINAACGFTNYGSPLTLNGSGDSVYFLLLSSGANLQNSNMSGKRVAFTFSYIAK